ncbi:MAG: glycosyltransferase family 39 protein [Candidatus Omnitrophica bacterium]|nr:glycosyltransferase family 39 protein [Candidatus Omnitrophota bacterium]
MFSKKETSFLWLIALALLIKFALYLHILFDPSSIIEIDSHDYLLAAQAWQHYFQVPAQGLHQGLLRTCGYPFFLTIFHLSLKLPLMGIIFLQNLLNILTAVFVFKAVVCMTDRETALLGAAIVLLDLPTMVFSDMIMTESLHLFTLSLFLYAFVRYINSRHMTWLLLGSIFLGLSVYVRPVSYFLGLPVAGFVLYLWGIKKWMKGLLCALTCLVVVYGLLFIWQYHNLKTYGQFTFSSIDKETVYSNNSIIGRYARETDPMLKRMPPVLYYVHSVGRNFLTLMGSPGNMKYFHSKAWKFFGIVFGYSFVVFWWIGMLFGLKGCLRDKRGQLFILVLMYFILVSLVSTGWRVTPRFRVPMLPCIAFIAAYGWMGLLSGLKRGSKSMISRAAATPDILPKIR